MNSLPWVDDENLAFPPVSSALDDPDGLLAAGGDLSPERLLQAYRNGIFPWYSDDQPILWWSPSSRCVVYPDELNVSRSLRKRLRQQTFSVRLNTNFAAVITACSQPRDYADSTWITEEMQQAYIQLHKLGFAHSIECYQDDCLVGGLYGVSLGNLFFGESMFHEATDASKVAFVYLVRLMASHGCPMIDCQLDNPHLRTLGGRDISRDAFIDTVTRHAVPALQIDWQAIPTQLPTSLVP